MDPEPDRTAIRLAERLIQLLGRGGFTATYKYAVLIALMDLCLELTSVTGLPPDMITTRQLAEKVIEIYWPHCAPYDSERGVLRQNASKGDTQAEIIRHILQFRAGADANAGRRCRSRALARRRRPAPTRGCSVSSSGSSSRCLCRASRSSAARRTDSSTSTGSPARA